MQWNGERCLTLQDNVGAWSQHDGNADILNECFTFGLEGLHFCNFNALQIIFCLPANALDLVLLQCYAFNNTH